MEALDNLLYRARQISSDLTLEINETVNPNASRGRSLSSEAYALIGVVEGAPAGPPVVELAPEPIPPTPDDGALPPPP